MGKSTISTGPWLQVRKLLNHQAGYLFGLFFGAWEVHLERPSLQQVQCSARWWTTENSLPKSARFQASAWDFPTI